MGRIGPARRPRSRTRGDFPTGYVGRRHARRASRPLRRRTRGPVAGSFPGVERITRRRLLRDGAAASAAIAAAGSPSLNALAAAAKPGAPPYAYGFRSLTEEIRLPHIPVEGDLPKWLRGVLLRNGPALFEIGEQKLNHWFDGLAMLHAFAFGDGRVSYANRFLRSSNYSSWKRDGVMKYSEFGTDPCRAIYSGVSTLPVLGPVPNANVTIERLGQKFRAHTEIPVPVRFDPETLRTIGAEGEIPQGRLGTAHPHHDPRTGERFAYECDLVPPSGLRVISERRGKRRELAFVPQAKPGYLHSFALTRRYVAVFTQPWQFDLARFLSPDRGPIATNYAWDGSVPSQVILVDRKRGGVAATFELDPFFVFHHINAFDDGDRVVLDVCAHTDSSAVDALYLKNLRSPTQRIPVAAPRRITVDPAAASCGSATSPTATSSCRRRTTTRSTPGPTATPTASAPATRAGAVSSTSSPSSTSSAASRPTGASAAPTPASQSSSAARTPALRTTASCSRSCSTASAAPPTCSSSTPAT